MKTIDDQTKEQARRHRERRLAVMTPDEMADEMEWLALKSEDEYRRYKLRGGYIKAWHNFEVDFDARRLTHAELFARVCAASDAIFERAFGYPPMV